MRKIWPLFLAGAVALSAVPMTTYGAEVTRPEDGTTEAQPFAEGTGTSTCFRIPCLVTLDDGSIVAGCDARWTETVDGGGLDTIISRSGDMGKTWNYTFANYLGDNGNEWNPGSTAFIDPAMATDGKTVYLVADLFPAGIALNGANYQPVTGHRGYDENHNLVLAKADETIDASTGTEFNWQAESVPEEGKRRNDAEYSYHLEKIADAAETDAAYYEIKDAEGNTVEGFTVDAFFNIKGENVDTNLFSGDSPYFPYPTDYLYMTKSEDGGATWSIPTLLDVKDETEQTLLVGPGRGIVTSTGRILFTAYNFTTTDVASACIYSDDGGVTWERGEYVPNWSSEAVVTEADGRLFMFTRHGGYYVSDDMGTTWSERKDMGLAYNLNCQLSAITYSKKIDGKTAIIFSAPSSTAARAAGKIFVGLVQEDGSIDWAYEYSVNGDEYYAYSCLDECEDGSIALLYEGGEHPITFANITLEEILSEDAAVSMWLADENGEAATEVAIKPGEAASYTVNGIEDGAEVSVVTSDEALLKAEYTDGTLTLTAAEAEGLNEARVELTAGDMRAVLNVDITESDIYEKVSLSMGETAVYKDRTGNYADTDLSGVNAEVANVTLTGTDHESAKPEVQAKLATSASLFDGEEVNLSDCLYTFEAGEKENTFVISAKTAEGETVYLHPETGDAGYPNKTEAAEIAVEYNAEKEAFTLTDNESKLYFYKDKVAYLFYDRFSDEHENCYFELYAPSDAAESGIKGYEKVTSPEGVTAGGEYLIVAQAAEGNAYALYPTQNVMAKCFSVAMVTDTELASAGTTEITVEGVTEGQTEATVNGKTYYITVENEVKEVTLNVGENFVAPGALMSEGEGQEVVTLAENVDLPPYVAQTEIESGASYLFGRGDSILLNAAGENKPEGAPEGLAMEAIDFTVSADQAKMWTVTEKDGGYTIQDAEGKYLCLNEGNVVFGDEEQVLTVNARARGGFSISNEGFYLNDWGGSHTYVAGYQSDDHDWNFYAPIEGIVVTAEKAGTAEVIVGGVTYVITVAE